MRNYNPRQKQIYIIDKHQSWLNFSKEALKSAGFIVKEFNNYDNFQITESRIPDLIIIGFAKVTATEIELIKEIRQRKVHLLALSSFLSWNEMRTLFLAGADDVAGKSFNIQSLINAVTESFDNISIKKRNKLNEYTT